MSTEDLCRFHINDNVIIQDTDYKFSMQNADTVICLLLGLEVHNHNTAALFFFHVINIGQH